MLSVLSLLAEISLILAGLGIALPGQIYDQLVAAAFLLLTLGYILVLKALARLYR